MTRRHRSPTCVLSLFALMVLLGPTPARAQSAAASPSSAAQTPADDDAARLDLAEPDFSIVNLPTTLRLPRNGINFHLTHRFNENLRQDSFGTQASNLFGLDQGANISLEVRFGVMRGLQAIAQRTNIGRTVQFTAKYDAIHQSETRPLSVSGLLAVEGGNNFGICSGCSRDYAPSLAAVVSRKIGTTAGFYAVPTWVHNSEGGTAATRDTGFLGLGGRVRVLATVYFTGEVTPRLGGYVVGDPEYGFGIEKRVGAHVFQLVFSNSQGTTFRQLSHGGNPDTLYFGFNLTRKFF